MTDRVSSSSPDRSLVTAMVCLGAVSAQYLVGKAIRDGVYLSQFDKSTLPRMMLAMSAVSIVLAVSNTKVAARLAPARLVPTLFTVSALLFIVEWFLIGSSPEIVAIGLFLHVSGLGPLLGSGFWLILSERFDPRSAKRRIGQIAAVGTLVGVVSGVITAGMVKKFGSAAILPLLAVINVFCAWATWRLATPADTAVAARPIPVEPMPAPSARSGFSVLATAPHLRTLAMLVLLGTMGAVLFEVLLKGTAQDAFTSPAGKVDGNALSWFFTIYYAAAGFVTFVVQTSWSRRVLERFGLSAAASSPSAALLAGGVGSLAVPGLASIVVARAGESVCRSSLFRAGYELFYAPIASADKRAVKSIIDVGADRLGDAVGSGLLLLLALAPAASRASLTVWVGMGTAAAALVLARQLNRGYIQALEKGLLDRAVDLDLSDVEDRTTRATILRTIGRRDVSTVESAALGAEVAAILALRSGNREAAGRVLRDERGLSAALVPHAIPLLARGSLAAETIVALRSVAEERVGALVDALLDPNQDFVIRRRLARVFSVCVSQRAADGLLLALDDLRFEVRFQCGRSLAAIVERSGSVRLDRDRVLAAVQREVDVARPVWEGRRLLDDVAVEDLPAAADEFTKEQASQSLGHVFTLLSLILPREPLKIAFRGLQTDNQQLRGTSLEYLEGILPPAIRTALWPFLEAPPGRPAAAV
jgi:hypothetical protein